MFTIVPDDHDDELDVSQHYTIATRGTEIVRKSARPRDMLHSRERELFKTILSEAVEVLLRRHEICSGEAVETVCIPTFLFQLERLLATCMVSSIVNRIEKHRHSAERDTWSKMLVGMRDDLKEYASDLIRGTDSSGDMRASTTMKTSVYYHRSASLEQFKGKIIEPVSAEEMHVGLMNITATILSADKGANPLKQISDENRGILEHLGNVQWIFSSEGHAEKLRKFRPSSIQGVPSGGLSSSGSREDFASEDDDDDLPEAPSKSSVENKAEARVVVFEDALAYEEDFEVVGNGNPEASSGRQDLKKTTSKGQWGTINDLLKVQEADTFEAQPDEFQRKISTSKISL